MFASLKIAAAILAADRRFSWSAALAWSGPR